MSSVHTAVKWSFLGEIASKALTPLVFLVLAWLLTPDDFGVVAVAAMIISFSQIFWDAGLNRALVQTKHDIESAANVVFWTNIFLSVVIYILLLVMAPWLAEFFSSPDSEQVLRILGLQLILAAFSSVQQALLVRDLDFRRLFFAKLVTSLSSGLFGIPLAFYGYGVWALVVGTLAGQIFNLVILWSYSSWRPKLNYDLSIAREIFRFGVWILAGSFGSWLIMWGDSLIIAKYLGVHDLGIYRIGGMIVATMFALSVNPIQSIVFPALCRIQNDVKALRNAFHKVNQLIITLSLAMGVAFLILGSEVADLLFGHKWEGLGFVLIVLGFREAISWAFGINSDVFKAMGRPEVPAKLEYVMLLWIIPAYIISANYGFVTFLYARFGVTVVGLVFNVFVLQRALDISPFYLWHQGKTAIVAAAIMGVGMFFLKLALFALDTPIVVTLVVLTLSGAGLYLATLWLLDRSFVQQTNKLIRQSFA